MLKNNWSESNFFTRRKILQQAGAASLAASVPWIVPASVFGGEGRVAPSDRIVIGSIGTGNMGRTNLGGFMRQDGTQVVAACDVDRQRLAQATEMINQHYGNQDCQTYTDFRELLARDDLDAVVIATPDHWHALAAIAAAKAGKDIYCEKPLANSVGEGRAVCQAVQQHNRILQTGSHERSNSNARRGCELVRNGRLGKIHTVRIQMPCDEDHHNQVRALQDLPPTMPVPSKFDYDFWLGHTPVEPYTEKRCHFWWRFILAYGGGEMTDRGAHIIDLAQLGLGTDHTGPVEFTAKGKASSTSLYDAFMDFEFENVYSNGVRMIGNNQGPRGVKFEGDQGWLFIHVHGGKLEAEPASLLEEKIGSDETQLGRTPNHRQNFLDAVRSRQAPFATAEIGHRTATICHLNNLAMRLNRTLRWNPQAELIVEDDSANALLSPTMRSPWKL